MINRPRRLRENPLIRGMIRETRASKDSLIYPVFFEEGRDIKALSQLWKDSTGTVRIGLRRSSISVLSTE